MAAGFSEEFGVQMQEFASSTVKESRTLQAEFRAARTEVVKAINEGKCAH
jgi:hypothetical protein